MYSWKDDIWDWKNSFKKRNLHNVSDYEYNCGGFALKTFNWYLPTDNYEDISDEILWYLNFNSIDGITEMFLEKTFKRILEDFPELVECNIEDVPLNQTIIAYRIGIEDEFEFDWDFHFKIRECGEWKEKRGHCSVDMCDLIEFDDWMTNDGFRYNSKIKYLTYRKSDT